jgi:hypothetical protein
MRFFARNEERNRAPAGGGDVGRGRSGLFGFLGDIRRPHAHAGLGNGVGRLTRGCIPLARVAICSR